MDLEFKTIFAQGEDAFDKIFNELTDDGWIPNNSATSIPAPISPKIMLIMQRDKSIGEGWVYKKESATRYNTGDPFEVVLEIYERPHGDGTIRLQRLWQWQCKNAKEAEGEKIECILPGSMSHAEYEKGFPSFTTDEQYSEEVRKHEAKNPRYNKIFYTFADAKEFVKTWIEENPID